jgi:hypothetical protein
MRLQFGDNLGRLGVSMKFCDIYHVRGEAKQIHKEWQEIDQNRR